MFEVLSILRNAVKLKIIEFYRAKENLKSSLRKLKISFGQAWNKVGNEFLAKG